MSNKNKWKAILLHKNLVENTIPFPEAKLNKNIKWMCDWCTYKQECDLIEDSINPPSKEED